MSDKKKPSKASLKPKTKKEASKKIIKTEKENFLFTLFSTFSQALTITTILILLTVSFVVVGITKRADLINNNPEPSPKQELISKRPKEFFGSFSSQLLQESGQGEIALEQASFDSHVDMVLPESIKSHTYNYIYIGEPLETLDEELEVYRKMEAKISDTFLQEKIALFDLSALSNSKLVNLSLEEDRPYGYALYLDLKNNNISLYKNWEKWPEYDSSRPTRLSEQQILNISNRFLSDYKIDLSNYADGRVQDYGNLDYEPDTVTVVYPLVVDNFLTYEEYGNFSGLTVQVDLREKRVSSLYNLSYDNYESSMYDSQRDNDLILEMLSRGGRYPNYFYSEEEEPELVDIKIGTPSIALARIWQYDENFRGTLFLVPSYVFPVLSDFSRENIIIPLIKDFFDFEEEASWIMLDSDF